MKYLKYFEGVEEANNAEVDYSSICFIHNGEEDIDGQLLQITKEKGASAQSKATLVVDENGIVGFITSTIWYFEDGSKITENIQGKLSTSVSHKENYENIVKLEIGNGVTSIDPGSFANCTKLQEIILSNSITEICGGCFYRCISLKKLTIPNKVVIIGVQAFNLCESLESLIIPKSVLKIEDSAFSNCKSLNTIFYNGNIEDWNNIEKTLDWNQDIPAKFIYCNDGLITL